MKDVISHIIGWDIYFTNVIKFLEQGKQVPHWGNINEHNRKSVLGRKRLSWEKIYKQFIKASQVFTDKYKSIPDELQEELIWKDKSYTTLKLLQVNIHHYETHLKAIGEVLKKSISDGV